MVVDIAKAYLKLVKFILNRVVSADTRRLFPNSYQNNATYIVKMNDLESKTSWRGGKFCFHFQISVFQIAKDRVIAGKTNTKLRGISLEEAYCML